MIIWERIQGSSTCADVVFSWLYRFLCFTRFVPCSCYRSCPHEGKNVFGPVSYVFRSSVEKLSLDTVWNSWNCTNCNWPKKGHSWIWIKKIFHAIKNSFEKLQKKKHLLCLANILMYSKNTPNEPAHKHWVLLNIEPFHI